MATNSDLVSSENSEEMNSDLPPGSTVLEATQITNDPPVHSVFAAKKTVAQGMMDLALITSNANQLRYLLEYGRSSATFEVIVVLIIISLMLQVAVGILLIFKGRYDLQGEAKRKHANHLNNYVVMAIFIVSVINVFVAAFSIPAAGITPAIATPTVIQERTSATVAPFERITSATSEPFEQEQ